MLKDTPVQEMSKAERAVRYQAITDVMAMLGANATLDELAIYLDTELKAVTPAQRKPMQLPVADVASLLNTVQFCWLKQDQPALGNRQIALQQPADMSHSVGQLAFSTFEDRKGRLHALLTVSPQMEQKILALGLGEKDESGISKSYVIEMEPDGGELYKLTLQHKLTHECQEISRLSQNAVWKIYQKAVDTVGAHPDPVEETDEQKLSPAI